MIPSSQIFRASELLAAASLLLNNARIEGARRDARLLLCKATGLTLEALVADPDVSINSSAAEIFHCFIDRRCSREPVSQIIGRKSFWSLDLNVTQNVLDPRPDSESLVEAIVDRIILTNKKLHVLDLGTGGGALLLSLLLELPSATGIGVDKSIAAVNLAKKNAEEVGLSSRTRFVVMDWAEAIKGSFDVVVSNPPYVPSSSIGSLSPEVSSYDPHLALNGGPDGLACFRRIGEFLPVLLKPTGLAALEFGFGQSKSVSRILRAAGLEIRAIRRDLSGKERCILVSLSRK